MLLCVSFSAKAQIADKLKKEQVPKKAETKKLQGEIKILQTKIDALPGWRKSAFATIGMQDQLQTLQQRILALL